MTLVIKLKTVKGGFEHFQHTIHFWLPFWIVLSDIFSKHIIGFVQAFKKLGVTRCGSLSNVQVTSSNPYYVVGFNTLKYVKKYFIPWRTICQSIFEHKKHFRGRREVWDFWIPCILQFYKTYCSWHVLKVPIVSRSLLSNLHVLLRTRYVPKNRLFRTWNFKNRWCSLPPVTNYNKPNTYWLYRTKTNTA